ncbi:MAG: pitrilysin family protein [Vicinamibacterales bacterium]
MRPSLFLLPLVVSSVAVYAGGCAHAGRPTSTTTSASDAPATIPFEKYVLSNGLEVILSEDRRLPLVAVNVWYHVGPANEAAGRTGFAHLFEHMMFQGSKHVPGDSHFQLLEAAGASNVNGTTSFDRTNYFETLPANELELGLWMESDRMGYLLDTVDELKLANQQDVVRNERRQSHENVPYGMVQEALFHELFPRSHPYYGNVIGSHADIQAAKLDDVKQFFKQHYAPNNASLAIVGDINKTDAKRLVEQYFGPLKRGPGVPKTTPETPRLGAERRVVVRDRVELTRVYMAWLTPPFFKPGDADADAVGSILGGNKSSRLYKSLVYDKQIAQDVSAFQQSMALTSVFQIVATVRPGHTPEEVEAAIGAELERFRREGPSPQELQRARNTFETSMISGLENLGGFGGVADTLNQFNHYVGDPGHLPTYINEHRHVSAESVKAFATQFLVPSSRVVLYGVPGEPDLGVAVATPPPPAAAPGTGAEAINPDAAWRATRPQARSTAAVSLPTPSSFTLPNGLTVIYQVRQGLPVGSASLVFRTGGDANPADRSGLANFTMTLLDQGTATRNAAAIADELAQIGASLTATSAKDSMSVWLGSLTRNFEPALSLLADVALHPTFPADEVERQRRSRLANLAATHQSASGVASINAVAALFGPAHPYGYIELGNEAAAKATTRDDIAGFWKRNFVPGNAALIVASPLGEAALRALVEKTFGGWAAGTVPQPAAGTGAPTRARIVLNDRPGAPQTELIVASLGVPRSVPEYPALTVMNAVLGGLFSSRINLNLREAHGYTYGASTQFVWRKQPGIFWVTTAVRTDATAPAVSEIFNELGRIIAAPMTAEELTMAKDSIVRGLPSEFETSDRTVDVLSNLFIYQLGLNYYAAFPAQITGVTSAAAQGAARRYLDPARMIVVAVGDRSKIEPGLTQLNLGAIEVRNADGGLVR